MFYLVKYMTKDSVKLSASLSTLVQAKEHIDKWASTADDTGDDHRTAVHFLQRATNSYMSEVHDTQAASLLLNQPASLHSERFVYVAAWEVVRGALAARDEEVEPDLADVAVELEGEEEEEEDMVEIGRDTEPMSGSPRSMF